MTDRTVAITPGSGDQVAFDDNSQIVKMVWGATGTHTKVEDGAGKRLPVNLAEINVTVPVSGTFWQATQPISASALPLPSGAATAAKQPALGTAGTPSADVISVQGVSGGTAVPVSGTFWQTTQPVSGPLTDTQLRASAVPVSGTVTIQDGGGSITVDGTFWQATQPVSIAATVTVDSELPAAQSIAGTGLSVVNAPPVGAVMLTYNGTTWDSVQTGAGDGVTSVGKVPGAQYVFNGSTYDRARTITATMDQAATGIVAAGLVAQLDDVSTQTVTENQVGVVRMSSRRALLVEGVASGTNINTNIAQINGVTPLMGNGASGTGAQRVTIANDSTGILAGVTTVTTLTNITNWGNIVDNAAFTDGTTRLLPAGFIFDETAGTALTENDAAAARVDSKRAQVMVLEDGTTRGTRQGVTSDGAAKAVAKFLQVDASTLTRPANTTAYSANDAVSNNATAGSVTAQTVAFSAIADHPVSIERVRVRSTDTGVAGKAIRVYLFNSDPTASSGVGGGDNAAWSQKLAGFIGSVSGVLRSFSDGAAGVLVPDEGSRIIAKPGSGVTTIWLLWQTLDAWTPSANSTTFIATLEGFQGHS